MRKLDLTPYDTHRKDDDGKALSFDVRGSAIELLFVNGRLPPLERMKREALAQRIEDESGDTILLENADWDKLDVGLTNVDMPGREFTEFVRRILEAPTVDVKERQHLRPVG